MRSTVYDMVKKYDNTVLNEYFKNQTDSDSELTRNTYSQKNGY